MFVEIPQTLRAAEFSRVDFLLEFRDLCQVSEESLLRLRRELRQAAHFAFGAGERFAALFDPPLPADPMALRRVQRPGPPFVILPPGGLPRLFEAGDIFSLPVIFWGSGRLLLADFTRALQALGPLGLYRGEGRFELAAIEGEDEAGNRQVLWQAGGRLEKLAAPIRTAAWWLETALPEGESLFLRFRTPARLLSAGRPLFRPTFGRLFPFLLRRVTSVLYAHCGLEPVEDPRELIACAGRIKELENHLGWRDWRTLAGEAGEVDLGGVAGSLRIEREPAAGLLWVLGLGTLMNLGKGAAYGAGHFDLGGSTASNECRISGSAII